VAKIAFARIEHVNGQCVKFELSFGRILIAQQTVNGAAPVAQQVLRFEGFRHHTQIKSAACDEWLDRADARRAVFAERANQHDAGSIKQLLSDFGQFRRFRLEIRSSSSKNSPRFDKAVPS
jgi:hypothetical protein